MSNYEIHLMRMRGYSDGAGARPMSTEYSQDSSYCFAYSWGQTEKRQFADLSAHSLGLDIQSVHALESKHVGPGGSTAKVPTEPATCSICGEVALWQDAVNGEPVNGRYFCQEHAITYGSPKTLIPYL